jgi:hypothetical protein
MSDGSTQDFSRITGKAAPDKDRDAGPPEALRALSREQLLELLEIYAKNWLAHDGLWFLAVEKKFDMETAIELDTRAWERFSVIEAKRIMAFLDLPEQGGLMALERALQYRLYATVNRQEAQWVDPQTLRFRMTTCRVQQARRRQGMADFPCKPVGQVEYSVFASAIDPRIHTRCLSCPPDAVGEGYCHWEFTLPEGDGL